MINIISDIKLLTESLQLIENLELKEEFSFQSRNLKNREEEKLKHEKLKLKEFFKKYDCNNYQEFIHKIKLEIIHYGFKLVDVETELYYPSVERFYIKDIRGPFSILFSEDFTFFSDNEIGLEVKVENLKDFSNFLKDYKENGYVLIKYQY